VADSISSSWAVCENDITAGYAQAENTIFRQMAAQGQAVFGGDGDTGAFGCIRSDGTTIPNLIDPPSQPWVTAVGGTSFENFNPGTNPHPSYGTTHCSLAAKGTPCREAPDISANADEFTPYAEYCTGSKNTPFSVCAQFSGAQPVPGWFGIGGTSLSSPLVSAIIADRDSFHGNRSGNINPTLYQEYRSGPQFFFHDVTSAGHIATNNGLFPAVPGYDLATGIGTIRMTPFIVGFI
jgi:subtilase family serine protease